MLTEEGGEAMTRKEVNALVRSNEADDSEVITATLSLGVLRRYEYERLCSLTLTPWRVAMEYLDDHPTEFCLSMSKGIGEELDAKAIAQYLIHHCNKHENLLKHWYINTIADLTSS